MLVGEQLSASPVVLLLGRSGVAHWPNPMTQIWVPQLTSPRVMMEADKASFSRVAHTLMLLLSEASECLLKYFVMARSAVPLANTIKSYQRRR
jgi:hypothetical protein